MQAIQQNTTDEIIDSLLGRHILIRDSLRFSIGEFSIRIRSNSSKLLSHLADYFSHFAEPSGHAEVELIAIEADAPELPLQFTHWCREPGKTGRKDSYHDMAYCRLVRKVRTGMVFLQSADLRVATGPCLANENQVINFINAQYMNWLQYRDWRICHAAALTYDNRAYAFAGFSGGGKSTLMLHLLTGDKTAYLTNDRLFIRTVGGEILANGIPKLPRVNPGTIVHNPSLHGLISPQQRQTLLAMPNDELRELEDKYDVDIEEVFGPDRIVISAPLQALIILNWQHNSRQALSVDQVSITEREDLLDAVMKSPGPFYQYPNRRFYRDNTPLTKQPYLDLLKHIVVYEVTGGTDFAGLAAYCREEIFG